jgi:hypothetical protein
MAEGGTKRNYPREHRLGQCDARGHDDFSRKRKIYIFVQTNAPGFPT